jgi:hypothetical protein
MRLSFVLLLVLVFCGCAPVKAQAPRPTLALSARLEPQRIRYELLLDRAMVRVSEFAKTNGWSALVTGSLVERVAIFHDRASFDDAVRAGTQSADDFEVPSSWTATLHHRSIFAIARDSDENMVDLLVHELVHQLHADATSGDESTMGPTWFAEGLAVMAANQYESAPLPRTERIRDILWSPKRGDYREYGAMVRALTSRANVSELVTRASQPDFSAWAEKKLIEIRLASRGSR